jgi:hypothetical protein
MMRGRVSSGCGDVSPREMLEQERFEYAPCQRPKIIVRPTTQRRVIVSGG